jgi:hypothetical protein
MSTITQTNGTIQTALSTELDSLANNSLVLSSAITLTSAGYVMGQIELTVTFGSTPTQSRACPVWFLTDIDGTDYEIGDSSVTPARIPDLILPILPITTIQRITRRGIALPPGTFKVLLKNDGTGQAMASSGNTLKILPYTYVSS